MEKPNISGVEFYKGRPLDDDGERCVFCEHESGHALENHHVIPQRIGGANIPKNVVTVCANCHSTLEAIYNDLFWARVAALDISVEDFEGDSSDQTGLERYNATGENGDGQEPDAYDGYHAVRRSVQFDILKDVYAHEEIDTTQTALAECIGVSQTRISQALNGHCMPDVGDAVSSVDAIGREVVEREARLEVLRAIMNHEEIETTQTALAECADMEPPELSRALNDNS